jgi:hypothetical protein
MRPTENIERLIKKLEIEASEGVQERILRETLELAQNKSNPGSASGFPVWRMIMKSRITKFAIAAAIMIAVGFVVHKHGEKIDLSSVTWAEVAAKVQHIPSVVYKMKVEMTGLPNMPKDSPLKSEAVIYSSMEFGTRMDNTVGGNLSQNFINPSKRIWLTVMPATKKYIKMTYDDNTVAKSGTNGDLRQMVSAFTKFGYKDIGYRTINGVHVAGIEVNDMRIFGGMLDKGVSHLWIDTKTELPVLMEFEGTTQNDSIHSKMVMYDFEWNIDLEATVFEPNIGPDYSMLAKMEMPQIDETNAIKGFKLFSKASGGTYPSSLSMLTVMKEYGKYDDFKAKIGKGEPNEAVRQEFVQRITLLSATYGFYAKLQNENKDPAYHGDKVASTDSDLPLLRWKVSNNQFRVIYGDLHVEDVGPERLAELERH